MTIFFELVVNLFPLYGLIAAGFFIGRFLHIDRETLINIVLYLCLPIVVFGFIAGLDLKPAYALLPLVMFLIQAVIGLAMLRAGRAVYGDARANLLSMCTAMGNGGYFGLPLVLLLFPPEWVGVYMFMLLGGVLYEGTLGYYIAARGKFTVGDSIRKVLKFPSIYAVAAGLLVNLAGIDMPDLFITYWGYFKGAYVILGMMIIGAALSKVDRLVFAPRFLVLVALGKFIAWPVLAYGFVALDSLFFHLFDEPVHMFVIVSSLMPPAANIAAFAEKFDIVPAKAATTILIATLFALFYIPAVLTLIGMH
jgi:predicted permease